VSGIQSILSGAVAAASSLPVGIAAFEGGFRTVPVRNTTIAYYTLRIIAPSSIVPVAGYTFPISPANVRKEFTALTNFYDVQGSAAQNGVARYIDEYGNTPVIYTLEGTTGWKLHSTDNFFYTGMQSIQAVQALLNQYASLNAQQVQNGLPLFTMEFYDYFTGDYWQVVPIGPQIISQDQSAPLFFRYRFRLVGVRNLSEAVTESAVDPILNVLGLAIGPAASQTISGIGNIVSSYLVLP
jgi:hypothetical protein